MKSFFQRFHDSQPGASKSRARDAVYKQWIPSSKTDKDRSQPNNNAEHETNASSKQRAPKAAGLRPVEVPSPDALGPVTADYSTRFSTFPGSSTGRHLPLPLPLPQSRPLVPSASKVPDLRSSDDTKEKAKSSPKRNEATDFSGNETDAIPRTKSERPSRSRQMSAPPVSQQHQIWHPTEMQMGTTEKGKNKERLRPIGETDGDETRAPRGYDYLDRKEKKTREHLDQEPGIDSRQRTEGKGRERRERRRDEARGRVVKDVQQWEQQEKDMYQLREARERERMRERKEKEKQRDRTKERQKEEDEGRNEQKEEREREKEKENERERERERNREREKWAKEKLQREMEAKQSQLLQEQAQREAKEQQERERQAKELREQERRERKAREAREQQAERDRREQLELQRKERERREAEQRAREHQQQEKWEREQDERERKELERLDRDRRREERRRKELRQRESDQKEMDLLKLERERQEQRKREREQWEQQRERDREERERRWRSERHRETPEVVLTDTGTNDKSSIRSRHKGRRDGVSDSEKEIHKAQEPERQRLSPLVAQANTPPKSEDRMFPIVEIEHPAENFIKGRSSRLYNLSGGGDTSTYRREDSRQVFREDGYASESTPGQPKKDPPGRGADPSRPKLPVIREVRSPPPTHTQLPMDPPNHPVSGVSVQQIEQPALIVPITYKTRVASGDARAPILENSGQVNRLTEEAPRRSRPSTSDAQSSPQQSVPIPMNPPESAQSSSRPGPMSTETRSQGAHSVTFIYTPLTAARVNEPPQDIRILPPPPAIQVSQSSVSRVPSNTIQDTISLKDTRPSGQTEVHTQLSVGQSVYPKITTPQSYSAQGLEYSSPVVQSSASNHLIGKDPTLEQTQSRHPDIPNTESIRLNIQNSSLSRPDLHGPPLSQSPILITHSTPPTDPLAKEQITVPRHVQESSSPERHQKEVHGQLLSQSQPSDPLAFIVMPSRHVAEKRSNITPGQDETHQDLIQPLTKPTHTSRPSPRHTSSKIYDGTPQQSEPVLLHPSKQDSKSRVSPHTDKIPLQEITPPLSRQHPNDKSSHQDSQIHLPVSLAQAQPGIGQPLEFPNVRRDHYQRDHESARTPPSTDNHNIPLPRHQRYHSDTDTGRQGINPSRSYPVESPHIIDPQFTGPGGSKQRPGIKETEPENSRVDVRGINIAFRTPVVEPATAVDKKHQATDLLPNKIVAVQEALDPGFQKRKNGAHGVPMLVSHYEQLEETARLGGQITRPGTTVPRTSITRSAIPEAPSQTRAVVPPVAYSQSLSVPQVDRPNTAIGIRPSVSSASQSQSRNVPVTSSRQERPSKFELISFPDKSGHHAVVTVPTALAGLRDDYVVPQATQPSGLRSLQPIPEAPSASVPPAVPDRPATSHRATLNAPVLSHKVSYSDGAIVIELQPRSAPKSTTESYLVARTGPLPDLTSMPDRPYQQPTQSREEQILVLQHTGGRGELNVVQPQATHPATTQFFGDTTVHKDNTGNSVREPPVVYPTQPRSRKESSPRVRPRDDQPKPPPPREGDTDDYRVQLSRSNQAHGDNRGAVISVDARHVQRTEPTRAEAMHATDHQMPRYAPEAGPQPSQPPAYPQLSSADDKSRNRHDPSNYPFNSSQRTPPSNVAAVSPQRTGNSVHSTLDEEATSRSQTQVKDARLAELLSPPKPNDVPHHSYLHDARKNLVLKLDQQLSNSPSSAFGQSGNEASSRLRGSSGRGEHSPRYEQIGDSSPPGDIHSSPSIQQVDLSVRENSYSRSSPNASHYTPSPRVKTVAAETPFLQSGPVPPEEVSRPVPRQPPARERRQDTRSDTEEVSSRRYHVPPNYDVDARIDERSKSSHIPSASAPHQISDLQTGKSISQKDVTRKYTHDLPQSITLTHSRTRSDPQNMQDTPIPRSRHAYNDSHNSHNTISTQTLPPTLASTHVTSSSVLTIPSLGQLSDQMQYTRSYPSNQQSSATRAETSVPPPFMQATPMKSTPSKRNYITPLPPDAVSTNSPSNPQPPASKSYEIWLPPGPSSQHDQAPSRSNPTPGHRRGPERERDHVRRSSLVARARSPSPSRDTQHLLYQPPPMDPRLANAYHYIKTRKMRTMSAASLEAQDGAASTVIGSPTASILSQVPINIPPEQDPILAAREWTEAAAIRPGQKIRRPGLVWELPEDPPPIHQQEYRRPELRSIRSRRPRSSNPRTRETSDTD